MSVRLEQSSDKLSRVFTSSLTIGTGAFSIGLWFKRISDLNNYSALLNIFPTPGSATQIGLYYGSDGTTLYSVYNNNLVGTGYATAADTWYFAVVSRSGTTWRFRVFNEAGTKVKDETATVSTNWTTMDYLTLGDASYGEPAMDGEITVCKLHTGVAWTDGEAVTESTKFAIQKTGGTNRYAWGMETITADQFGVNEYGASGENLSNTGVVNGTTRPSVLESAAGAQSLTLPTIASGAALTPPTVSAAGPPVLVLLPSSGLQGGMALMAGGMR